MSLTHNFKLAYCIILFHWSTLARSRTQSVKDQNHCYNPPQRYWSYLLCCTVRYGFIGLVLTRFSSHSVRPCAESSRHNPIRGDLLNSIRTCTILNIHVSTFLGLRSKAKRHRRWTPSRIMPACMVVRAQLWHGRWHKKRGQPPNIQKKEKVGYTQGSTERPWEI